MPKALKRTMRCQRIFIGPPPAAGRYSAALLSLRPRWMLDASEMARWWHGSTRVSREAEALAAQADVATVADDEVIEDFDVEDLPGFDEFAGDGDIVGGRGGIAGGVVVGDNEGGRILTYRLLEDLGDADL